MAGTQSETAPKWLRPAVDYGPLAAFFGAYLIWGLMPATAVLIAVTVVGVLLSLAVERRVPMMPLVTAVVVCVFGGLTLWLNDPRFVKMKPTIVQLLFAFVLFGGLAFGRPLLRPLMGQAFPMDPLGWRKLTFRFACFFLTMAALNEAVWRTQSTDFWVTFKVFGILGLTLVFVISQAPMMQRHHLPEEAGAGDEERDDRPERG